MRKHIQLAILFILSFTTKSLSSYIRPVLTGLDVAVSSKEKLTWGEAKLRCEASGLTLLVLETEEDSKFLNNYEKLKNPPYIRKEYFWSGARFASVDYNSLQWEPTKQNIPDIMGKSSNGINKQWDVGEPVDDDRNGKDVCVDIRFPGPQITTPLTLGIPIWSASDCEIKKHYICVRPGAKRAGNDPQAVIDESPKVPSHRPATGVDIAVSSKVKLSWGDAKVRCEAAGLTLLVLESEEDNKFLNDYEKLKQPPYTRKETFWSGARFASTEYSSLQWEPTKQNIPVILGKSSNGISKIWDVGEPVDDDRNGKDVCVDIRFPGPQITTPLTLGLPIWSASDCEIKKHYICVRPGDKRGANDPQVDLDESPKAQNHQNIKDSDIAVSAKGKLSWGDAKTRCEASGLILLVIESEEDNKFLNDNEKLKKPPFVRKEHFWSGARFASTDYNSLQWEPTKQNIPNILGNSSNGIRKVWDVGEPVDDERNGKDVCVDIQFPGSEVGIPLTYGIPIWSASDCEIKRYYICVRPGDKRGSNNQQVEIEESPKAQNHRPIKDSDIAVSSKAKLSWGDAKVRCEASGLTLLVIESEEDNKFLNDNEKLKKPPFSKKEYFWSGARFASTDYSSLQWVPTKQNIPNILGNSSNGISKIWDVGEPVDDERQGKDVCVDIRFPGSEVGIPLTYGIPIWAASNCEIKKYYICVRPGDKRGTNNQQVEIEESPKGTQKSTPKPGNHFSGNFIPDSFKPIKGVMKAGQPALFKPNKRSEVITSPMKGTFLPLETNDLDFPFMTLYGEMKPYAAVKGTALFTPDDTISGKFIADDGENTFIGTMAQDNPALFTPDYPPYIQGPTTGNWIPSTGVLPNLPCNTIHGTMTPNPAPANNSVFTPDPSRQGTFTPDIDPQNPVPGKLSQTTLPKFTPDAPSFKFQKPTSGLWKPKPVHNAASISHGTMKPTVGEGIVFVPDNVLLGTFTPDEEYANSSMEGYMTKTVPQIFTPHQDTEISSPIHGKWMPDTGNSQEIQGTLKPANYLPTDYAVFEPDGKY